MLTDLKTHKIQSAFATYCHKGDNPAMPGIKEERLKHYRRLVYNNVNESLRSAYPLACNFLKEETWEEVVNDFFMNYACQSPQIWQMPYEFYQYLTEKEHQLLKDHEFLAELLLMEWLEVELFMMEDIKCEYSPEQKTEDDRLVMNPEHRLLVLNYPIHLKKASSIKASDKGNFYLLMHRKPTNGSVVFTDVSVFFAGMLKNLSSENSSKKKLLLKTCKDFNLELNDEILRRTNEFIEKAFSTKLILGFTN